MDSTIQKLKRYMRKEMKKLANTPKKEDTFSFCWGQAKFDTLMDIDLALNLGVFFKKGRKNDSKHR